MFVIVDIETTGLETNDYMLEVGILLATDDLEPIDSTSHILYHNGVIEGYDPIVQEMHSKSGLWEECKTGKTLVEVENLLCTFLEQHNAIEQPMCGSSVHFDRGFLKREMPMFEAMFHYRNIDVSTVKNLAERWAPETFENRPTGKKLHRVDPDCEDTLEELKFYKEDWL